MSYAYSVSDPIAKLLPAGTEIPYGTAEGGGFGISVSPIDGGEGIAVYWQQSDTGWVYLKEDKGYSRHVIKGAPNEFCVRAKQDLGHNVHVWFGQRTPMGLPESVHYFSDSDGRMRIAAIKSGGSFIFTHPELHEGPYKIERLISLEGATTPMQIDDPTTPMNLTSMLSADRSTVTIELHEHNRALGHIILDAAALDQVIEKLGELRMQMRDQVATEIPSGIGLPSIVDPAWRTHMPPHSSIPGPSLALRHPGFGWVSFIFPSTEARAIAEWLMRATSQGQDR
ncbi:MAG: hypothetical protein GEV13_15670 [Rhodospirillales bacterium]|nr:hypothetical protein [Rhodospirillales bacterium]